MIYGNFKIAVAARVTGIVLLIVCLFYCFLYTHWLIVPLIISVLIVFASVELVRYAEGTSREFANFLLAIKSGDFSRQSTLEKRGKNFSSLREAENIIIDEFQKIRIDKEAHYFFLDQVIRHVDTAMLCFNREGEVVLLNEAAKNLLRIAYLKNIHSLQVTDPALYDFLNKTGFHGNSPLQLERNGEQLRLSVRVTKFIIRETEHKLLSIQNIKNEFESAELMAWERLIQVLTHEIMNSITPISSLSATLKGKASLLSAEKSTNETISDIAEGLNVIERRSVGLVNFVNNYRKLLYLPPPVFKTVFIAGLFERVKLLKQAELFNKHISFSLTVKPGDLSAKLDPELVEQVLINLVNNAADALQGIANASIELLAESPGNKINLSLRDNGCGIDKESLDKIFVPFYTTKKSGTGIGLSFSKQIMHLHHGSISVQPAIPQGSVFTLSFPVRED